MTGPRDDLRHHFRRTLVLVVVTALAVGVAGIAGPDRAGRTTDTSPSEVHGVPGIPMETSPIAATEVELGDQLVGINTHLVWNAESSITEEFGQIRSGGVGWVREMFPWAQLEPTKGSFKWSYTDRLMSSASNANVDVLGILAYSASWSASKAGTNNSPPRDATEYAEFAAAVAARYGPGGTFWESRPDLVPRPVTALQIWNEPWGWWFWQGQEVNPAAYGDMAVETAKAIHAANPDVEIVIPADILQVRLDGAIRGWFEELLTTTPELVPLVDVWSVHNYPYPRNQGPDVDHKDPRWDFRRLTMVDGIAAKYGARKPLWITEVGWSTAPSVHDGITEATQAEYLRRALEIVDEEYAATVERIFLYSWDADGTNISDREHFFGVRRNDKSFKPAWDEIVDFIANREVPLPPPTEPKPDDSDGSGDPPDVTVPTAPADPGVRTLSRHFEADALVPDLTVSLDPVLGRVDLSWSGAVNGVDIRRDGKLVHSITSASGSVQETVLPGIHTYQACSKATQVCSQLVHLTG